MSNGNGKPLGIALCLSGGGFRAALFHLGALRRLNELGVLSGARTITSVSGGSIMAAHLATAIARGRITANTPVPASDWEQHVAGPIRAFTSKNIRSMAVLRQIFSESGGVEALARRYAADLTNLRLRDLPDHPSFVLCATDMAFGVNWVFEKQRMGDYQVGYAPVPSDWQLARAVAASACFPPVFNPLPIPGSLGFSGGLAEKEQPKKWREALSDLRLTDGGNYDNMGLEPAWNEDAQTHEVILVSDGGGLFDFESDRNLIWRIQRYQAIQENQARGLRRRWLIAAAKQGQLQAAYWGAGSATARYGGGSPQGYSKDLARDVIAAIRTDLDAFSEVEAAVLENHGYLLSEAAIRAHVSKRFVPNPSAPLDVPHKGWFMPQKTEDQVRAALDGSNVRKKLGRW